MQGEIPYRSTADASELRILTYNVHSCRGTDRRHDPGRIAEVIASCNPDIIALQELDVGRMRSGNIDQAEAIAEHLRMQAHFHPALHIEEERYGDAILTALPSRLVKAGLLTSVGEPRGALWVEIEFSGHKVQVINTHLGLRRRERIIQAAELVGHDWAGSDLCCSRPTIVTGDFNSVPMSRAYDLLINRFSQGTARGMLHAPATFPSRYPLLKLDHVFTNSHLCLTKIAAINTPLARVASDHLPLLATIGFSPTHS